MTEAELDLLRDFLRARSGLSLGPEKRYLVEVRLDPVRRAFGLDSLSALVGCLRGPADPALVQAVVEAMTINETLFFRDKAPFEAIRETILPQLVKARAASRRLRIWSAAASTGQEAYSLAMILAEMTPPLAGWDVSILGTDISGAMVAKARTGTYSHFEVQRGLPIRALLRHFTRDPAGWTIAPQLRGMVTFQVFNLLDDVRRLGTFDLILCRNLLIYLDTPTKAALLRRLSGALAPDGILCLGTAEVARIDDGLEGEPGLRGFYGRPTSAARRVPLAVAG